jgi:hypothetical protein
MVAETTKPSVDLRRRRTWYGSSLGHSRWALIATILKRRPRGGPSGSSGSSFVLSSQRLAMLLPIMTAPITSRTTTMIVTLFSTSHSRSPSNGPRIRADAMR